MTRRVALAVKECGIAKFRYERERNGQQFVDFDLRTPGIEELRALCVKLGDFYVIPEILVKRSSSGLISADGIPPTFKGLFGARSGPALALLGAVGAELPITKFPAILGGVLWPFELRINVLEAFGVLSSGYRRGQRLVRINDDWQAAPELRQLLRAMLDGDPTYTDVAEAYKTYPATTRYIS